MGFDYHLKAVRIFTADFGRALDFYTRQVGMTPDSVDEAAQVAVLPTGEAVLLLEAMDPTDDEAGELVGRFVGVSLAVEDIRGVYDTLSANGVRFSGPLRAQPWGGIMTHFHDPDDNVLTLIQWDRK